MLDHFSIFTKGGIVLWSFTQVRLKGSPIDLFIRNILLEERTGENCYNVDMYTIKWCFANEFDLIFVAIYQKILQLLYIEELLEIIKKKFLETYKEILSNPKLKTQYRFEFDDIFLKNLSILEQKFLKMKQENIERGPRKFSETEKGKELQKKKKKENKEDKNKQKKKNKDNQNELNHQNEELDTKKDTDKNSNFIEDEPQQKTLKENILKFKEKMAKKFGAKKTKIPVKITNNTKKDKIQRKWEDSISQEEKKALDYSKEKNNQQIQENSKIQMEPINLDDWSKYQKEEEEEEEEEIELSNNTKNKPGRFMSFLKGLAGNKILQEEDIIPILSKFKDHLISKNVASEIAEKLCDSVSISLQGKKLGTFQGIKSIVRTALEEALVRILTPKKNIDILRDAIEAKKEKRPYVVVFVGVNGVGKSTNLAKVCSYLMQNDLICMLAACDTFRSGAVEQLEVHAKRLNVELFQRGYRTDPTLIALDAIRYAKQNNINVVLIDTAGRMQNNEPLMKALSKLVNTTKPDLVLFVGEALVGNDAVDQLTNFNKALMDLSTEKQPRLIDGIILSKFDTIDDKVGAAISMVYTTGQPIVFLGTGQHYEDLRRMNISVVTRALLKGA